MFIGDFVVRGWAHFATFGRSSAGGWATAKELYCLGDTYDQSTENFKVSYLKHEARHFADYKMFPKLEQTDLEYRAKLTELAFAKETLYRLIGRFAYRANDNQKSPPHSRANHAVIADLSKKLMGRPIVKSIDEWREFDSDRINAAARQLLNEHTARLKKEGAPNVRGVIQFGARKSDKN